MYQTKEVKPNDSESKLSLFTSLPKQKLSTHPEVWLLPMDAAVTVSHGSDGDSSSYQS